MSTSARHVQQTFESTMLARTATSRRCLAHAAPSDLHQELTGKAAVDLCETVVKRTVWANVGDAAAGSLAFSAAGHLRSARAMLQPKTPSSTPTAQAALGEQEEQSMSQAALSAALEVRRRLAGLQHQSQRSLQRFSGTVMLAALPGADASTLAAAGMAGSMAASPGQAPGMCRLPVLPARHCL